MVPIVLPSLYVAAAVVVAYLFHYRNWHKETHDLMERLHEAGQEDPRDEDDYCITLEVLGERISKLPEVVQFWMKTALPFDTSNGQGDTKIPFARSLRVEQHGEFLLNKQWIRFDATQEFSCRQTHPGFVWDAQMRTPFLGSSLDLTFTVSVRDAYIPGVGGIMKANLPMGIPIVSMKDTDDLNLGEIMRWLAEATLFPFALLPQEHKNNKGNDLKWSAGSGNSAVLEYKHGNQIAKITFLFDSDTHMPKAIKAKRPRTVGNETKLTNWEGHFSDYEAHGGLLVPSTMEVGWQTSEHGPLELYFKGKNVNFIYLMNAQTRHKHSRDELHEHKD